MSFLLRAPFASHAKRVLSTAAIQYLPLQPVQRLLTATPFKFNDANANVYHVTEWSIYKDFKQRIMTASCKEVQAFHDTRVKTHHESLRCASHSPVRLEFYDDGWRTNTVLDFPVYDRIMNMVVRDAITDAPADTPVLRENIAWLLRLCVVDPKQMLYALNTLISQGKTSLATWLIEQGVISYKEDPYVHVLRQAICQEDFQVAKLIYAKYIGSSGRGRIPYTELQLIRHDLAGTGHFKWRTARPDMTQPLFVWLLSLPEFKEKN